MKQSYGWDAWDFISKSLATQNNKVFWATLKDISSFDRKYFYLFDYKNNFDKYEFNDIHREEIEYEMTGAVSEEDGKMTTKSLAAQRLVRVGVKATIGETVSEIALEEGCSEATIHKCAHMIRRTCGLPKFKIPRSRNIPSPQET